jgi:hypothetical protein
VDGFTHLIVRGLAFQFRRCLAIPAILAICSWSVSSVLINGKVFYRSRRCWRFCECVSPRHPPGRISLIKIVGLPNLGCSPCLRASVVGFLFFRPRAITAISRYFAALCLRSSAGDPPPIDALLKTKAQPQFDRTVTERLKFFFRVFQPSNHAQF